MEEKQKIIDATDTTVEELLNYQIGVELAAEYKYLQLAVFLEFHNWFGFAKFFKAQAAEERIHAMKFVDHLLDRNIMPKFKAIDTIEIAFSDHEIAAISYAFDTAYDSEKFVTKCVHALHSVAVGKTDKPAEVLLHWFINEQVEEEDQMLTWLERVKRAGNNVAALQELDAEAGTR